MRKFMYYSAICFLLLNGCSVTNPIFISNDNLTFKSAHDSLLKFSIDSHVFNPSNYKYQLKELFFDIDYVNQKIGKGVLHAPVELIPNDTIPLPLDCTINLFELQKTHQQILSKEQVDFQFTGEAFAVHPLKKIRKGFKLSITYNAKSFMTDHLLGDDIILNHIEIQKVAPFNIKSLTNSRFRLIISLRNKQPFDFKIKKIELSLKSESTDRVVLEGALDTIIDAPTLQKIKIPLAMETNNFNLLKNLGSVFLGVDHNTYIGTGNITISIEGYDFKIPFLKEFDMSTDSFGGNENRDPTTNTQKSYYTAIKTKKSKQDYRPLKYGSYR